MLILYDFKCPTCGLIEMLAPMGTEKEPCPSCGCMSRRAMLNPPRISFRAGVDPIGCPTLGDKWARAHEKAALKNPEENREW